MGTGRRSLLDGVEPAPAQELVAAGRSSAALHRTLGGGTVAGMPIDVDDRVRAWRHRLHEHPETGFDEHETSAFVADTLEGLGLEVARGVGRTGVRFYTALVHDLLPGGGAA